MQKYIFSGKVSIFNLLIITVHGVSLLATVVGDFINTMKTTFNLNFNLYQTVQQHGYIKT